MGYDPRQNSCFKFQVVDLNFELQHFNFTAEFKNSHLEFTLLENVFTIVF